MGTLPSKRHVLGKFAGIFFFGTKLDDLLRTTANGGANGEHQ